MRQLNQWTARYRRSLRAGVVAVDPGEDGDWAAARDRGSGAPGSGDDLSWLPSREEEDGMLDRLGAELRHDLARASLRLAQARRRQRSVDVPGHRRAVSEHEARVDALLDVYRLHLEIRHDRPATPVA